jgi:hypothetical protein
MSYPIPLNALQLKAIKEWSADDRLWTTQETVEFNLQTLARKILLQQTMNEFSTLRPQHTHSGSDLIWSGMANECPICLAKELAEAKRTNERLVELLKLGIQSNGLDKLIYWDDEVLAEFRRLGLNV